MKLRLAEIAHARSGDKADVADIGLFAWEPNGYAVLSKYVTVEIVEQHFAHLWPEGSSISGSGSKGAKVDRYDLPNLLALKFVLRGALNGGAASSLRSDNLGKTIGAQLLRLQIDIPDAEYQAVLASTQQALSNF